VGRGLGRDVALAFAREGADVVLAARSPEAPAEVAADVEALGQQALCVRADMSVPADGEAMVRAAVDRFGRVDSLVTVAYLTNDRTTLVETDRALESWRRQFEINLFGTLSVAQAVAPQMMTQRHGRIIFINSMATRLPAARMAPYIGSKSALGAMARVLALELGPYGIRVNSVHPGYIWGDRVRQIFERRARDNGTTYEEEYEKVRGDLALGYIPSSEEYAGTVVFLASELAAPITGESIFVNAGQTKH
jgi:NAD(P)-dependent dehydrogenase (short-subunit alcohol dehydrogenase family)